MTIPFNESEIQNIRGQAKGIAHHTHFNNAGASLPPDVVVEAVVNYLQEEALFGGYETEAKYTDQLERVYDLIATLINAERDEIALVENASTGWAVAFNGIDFKPGDEIITSEVEYATNFIGFLHAKKMFGVEIRVVASDAEGNLPAQAIEDAITTKTKLIAITHIPSSVGVMTPIIAIGNIARKHGILYMVDACQTVGHAPIDVKAIQCDILSVTGRKYLRAPRGTGFLFVRKEVQDSITPTMMDGHTAQWISQTEFKPRNDARRYELYEKNRALILGLGKAIEYALGLGIDRIWQRIQTLSASLRAQLATIDGVQVMDMGLEKCGIVTFRIAGRDHQKIKDALVAQNIFISVARGSNALLYMQKNGLTTVLRSSVHYYNTEEELTLLCNALKNIIAKN